MEKRVGIFLITVALIAGMVGCASAQYNLTISTTEGGEIATPGEGTFSYDEGTVVPLVVFPHTGYCFVNWTGDVDTIDDVNVASTTITMNGDYDITANFEEIPPDQYGLTISSTAGGSVLTPGEGTFTHDEGTVVDLVAEAEEGYQFVNWTGDVGTIADVNAASTNITMNGDYFITASFAIGIYDWYDLDAIRENLGGSYILMNDLDSTTAGYEELAAAAANGGKGWQPIGSLFDVDPFSVHIVNPVDPFTGSLDGQGYEIRDLFIGRPDEDGVGLFGSVGEGVIENLGVVNAEVTGRSYVGGLVGENDGAVSNSYSTGSVTGEWSVGGVAGSNWGTVSNSYSTGSVTGGGNVGGLVGWQHHGTVSNSYFTGSVTGEWSVGGLVAESYDGTVSNSYYNYDEVLINGRNIVTIGALFNEDFDQWLASDKFLDVNERLSQEDGYYLINDVSDFKQLLAFGQDSSLKFRLTNDLDLGGEPNFYIAYLAGEFDGNGHKVSNLRLNLDSVAQVGLFGYVGSSGKIGQLGVENVDLTVTSDYQVGGLAGGSVGTVSSSYSIGSVTGGANVGGLVGWNGGTLGNSYAAGSVAGGSCVGGLVGSNAGNMVGANVEGVVNNSYSMGSVTGGSTVGGLVGGNEGRVSNSFWDTETSGQTTSEGGTGKTTAEMRSIGTFSGVGWNIIAVANPGMRNTAYIWNIIDDETYPLLSWQSVG